jgi:hypothetical protein
MNVPARGGVKRTSNESAGATRGERSVPLPLKPGTPSKKLSSSIPCQCTAVGSGVRLTTVIDTGTPRSRTIGGPVRSSVSGGDSAPPSWSVNAYMGSESVPPATGRARRRRRRCAISSPATGEGAPARVATVTPTTSPLIPPVA